MTTDQAHFALLVARGVQCTRAAVTRTESHALGSRLSRGYHERYEAPDTLRVQARFSREGALEQMKKWFRAELQTGDAAFDALVYIETSTPEATAQLLSLAPVRKVIEGIVARGGWVKLEDRVLDVQALWAEESADARDDDLGARIAQQVIV